MKTFTRDYRIEPYHSPCFDRYFSGLNPCVFDIETTGLSTARNTARVILTAMLVPTEDGVRITQYLAEDPYEEDRVLEETMQFFIRNQIDYLITYNGASFDLPFMNRRMEALHHPYSLTPYDLDLYVFLKRYTTLPSRLDSLSQKSVERYLGIGSDRKDVITGRESVRLYYEYVTSKSPMLEKVILTHNREDVLQLYRILKIAGYDDFSSHLNGCSLHEALAGYGLPVRVPLPQSDSGLSESSGVHCSLQIRPSFQRNALVVRGRQLRAPYLFAMDDIAIGEMHAQGSRVWYDQNLHAFPLNAAFFPDRNSSMTVQFRAATADCEILLPLESYGKALYSRIPEACEQGFREWVSANGLPANYVNGFLILADDSGAVCPEERNLLSLLTAREAFRKVSGPAL